jgi:hypothetical protein
MEHSTVPLEQLANMPSYSHYSPSIYWNWRFVIKFTGAYNRSLPWGRRTQSCNTAKTFIMFRNTKHYNDNILHYYCCITTKIIRHKTVTFSLLCNEFVIESSPQWGLHLWWTLYKLLFTNTSTRYLSVGIQSNLPTLKLCQYNIQHLAAFHYLLCYSCQPDTSGLPIHLSHKFKPWYWKYTKNRET